MDKTKYSFQNSRKHNRGLQIKQWIIFVAICTIIAVIGFLIGYFSKSTGKTACFVDEGDQPKMATLYKSFVSKLNAKNIENNLRYFSAKPHAASTERNNELIDEIYRRFESYGFDTKYYPYKVLLSFPDKNQQNYVHILDNTGKQIFQSKGIETFLEPSENATNAYPPFHGNSPNGTVEGELVYANYGRYEDFETLENKHGVNISGKIVLVRYGKIYRGDKVFNAQTRGAIGVIIYSDPFDYAPVGKKFIEGRWLPDDGVQRGSVLKKSYKDIGEGDPLTPGYPAKVWAYRPHTNQVKGLPSIPSQPVSANDALHLLRYMGGPQVETSWRGSLNVTYRIGPYQNTSRKVKLAVFNKRKVKLIRNVCGTITGRVEPDRYVILGNHIDAWVFGGVDPSSGTSAMMEIARVIGELLKTGWRPRRTIKFCGWDGEEFGLLGSSEFVEEYRNQLRDRAVAYINLDSAVQGNESLVCAASPLLYQMMFDVHKMVPDPFQDNITVFQRSKQALPDKYYPENHKIYSLGSGSDFTSFYQFLGIPSLDMGYKQVVTNRELNISSYPVYHSLHDTFYWVKNFVDRDFTVHLTVARVAMNYLLKLSDSVIVPFDLKRYDDRITKDVNELSRKVKQNKGSIDTGPLLRAAENFTSAVREFLQQRENVDLKNALDLRILNDRLIQLEKGFIYVDGLPGRPYLKHYIMAPAKYNNYASSQLPAISDTLVEAQKTGDWNQVKKQLSITAYLIDSVADTLKSLT